MPPMTRPLTLLTIHAHPDDETITTGGVMARYRAEGLRVVCLTSNLGEHGEIVVPELDTPENHARLAEIRRGELAEALQRLGGIESRLLGYEDSGMMGTPDNDDPASFWQADVDEAIGRTVRVVREVQPDVVVGYNDFGGYGHPDHIRAAQVAKGAFERAGDPAAYPEHLAAGAGALGAAQALRVGARIQRARWPHGAHRRARHQGLVAAGRGRQRGAADRDGGLHGAHGRGQRAGHDARRRPRLPGRQARRDRGARDPDPRATGSSSA